MKLGNCLMWGKLWLLHSEKFSKLIFALKSLYWRNNLLFKYFFYLPHLATFIYFSSVIANLALLTPSSKQSRGSNLQPLSCQFSALRQPTLVNLCANFCANFFFKYLNRLALENLHFCLTYVTDIRTCTFIPYQNLPGMD